MDVSAVRSHLAAECTFPVDRETVLDRVGDVDLDGVASEQETVATVLERTDVEIFHSARAVAVTLQGSVGAAYVGRKRYDDRNGESQGPDDRTVHSF